MRGARVAVWGCCASRDIFAARQTTFEVVAYYARTTWIAQAAPPVPGADALFDGAPDKWERRMCVADLTASVVPAIIAAQPEVIVFDLVSDVRATLYERGPYVVSDYRRGDKRPLLCAAAPDAPERMILRDDPDRPARFAAAVATLAPQLLAALPDAALVVHAVRGVLMIDEPSAVGEGTLRETPTFDARITVAEATLLAALPGASLLEPEPELRVGWHRHPFGPLVVHFTAPYYATLLDRLEALAGLR
jgi:hypothetical protein